MNPSLKGLYTVVSIGAHNVKSLDAPFPQGQIRCPRTGCQALRRTSHDDSNSLSRSSTQYITARLLADGADSHEQENFTIQWDVEVRSEGEEMWLQPGERFCKSCPFCSESSDGAPKSGHERLETTEAQGKLPTFR